MLKEYFGGSMTQAIGKKHLVDLIDIDRPHLSTSDILERTQAKGISIDVINEIISTLQPVQRTDEQEKKQQSLRIPLPRSQRRDGPKSRMPSTPQEWVHKGLHSASFFEKNPGRMKNLAKAHSIKQQQYEHLETDALHTLLKNKGFLGEIKRKKSKTTSSV
jgi:hypothetical protein